MRPTIAHELPKAWTSGIAIQRLREQPEPAAHDRLLAARALALFVSDLSSQHQPGKAAVAAAISYAVRAHGGVRGCAGEVGAAYGERPETAAARMRWARHVIEAVYCPAAPCEVTAK